MTFSAYYKMADKSRPGLDLEFLQLEITDVKETGEELGRGSYGEVREAPSSLSIAKDVGELQRCYRCQSLEERVHELEAVVGSLKECIADLRAKNEELMQANTVS